MPAKQLVFNEEARRAMERGLNVVADSVSVTLGPKGRNVVIQTPSGPIITKDGVTVAKSVELECPYENLGAQLCIQVSSKTNENAGDGTTTATVLSRAFVREGLKIVSAGGNPISIKRGIDKAVDMLVEGIAELAKPIENKEQIQFVATISGNEPEVGKIVADAMEAVGKDGVITIEESRGRDTYMSMVEGMQFDKGFMSPFFVTNPERMECRHNNVSILLVDSKIHDAKALFAFIQRFDSGMKNPLLIVADSIDGEALQLMVRNVYQGRKNWVAVKTPGFANQKKDRPTLQTSGGLWYLSFDGSDDSLVTNSVDFSGTDEMTVIAGVRKLSDAAIGIVAELTVSASGINGSFYLAAPETAVGDFTYFSRGTLGGVNSRSELSGLAAPVTSVLAAMSKIATSSVSMRANSGTPNTDNGTQGTGNYSNAALYIGRRGGSSLPFNGHLYQLIIRGKTTPTGKLLETERFVARKTGVSF